jgi:hypothetical protein
VAVAVSTSPNCEVIIAGPTEEVVLPPPPPAPLAWPPDPA